MAIPIKLLEKVELFEAWSDALDYKVDTHIVLIQTKDPVKRRKLEALYKKAERVCDRLAQGLTKYE